MTRIFSSPEELEQAGFDLAPVETLESDPLFQHYQRKLIRIYQTNPYLQARPPRPYQVKYAALYACRKNNFPIWDMGVGKSFLACLLIHLWYGDPLQQGRLKPGAIQIVAPRHTLKLTWLDKELTKAGLADYAQIIHTEEDMVHSKSPIWLYSYDFLARQTSAGRAMAQHNRSCNPEDRKGVRKKGQTKYFLGRTMSRLIARQYPPHLLIGDEFHRLRANTERTRCFRQISRKANRKLAMTGTPMDGWVEHVATVLGILYGENSKAFPYTEETFTKRFTRVQTVNQDWATGDETKVSKERQVPGVNPAQLPEFYRATRHLMHRLMIRDPEVDGQVQFPPVNLCETKIPMVVDHAVLYDRIRREQDGAIQATLEQLEKREVTAFKARETVLSQIGILRMTSTCPWTLDLGDLGFYDDTSKIKQTIDIVTQAKAQGRKTIVFTSFIKSGGRLTQALNQAGLGAIRIYATDDEATPKNLQPSMRDELIEKFQEAVLDDYCVLVANLSLVSEGLTLTEASVVINFDHSWRALLRAQGMSRVIRPGQSWPWVDVYDLVHLGTVDAYVWSMVQAKDRANKALIDREVTLEAVDSSKLDALEMAKQMLLDNQAQESVA